MADAWAIAHQLAEAGHHQQVVVHEKGHAVVNVKVGDTGHIIATPAKWQKLRRKLLATKGGE